MAAFEGLEHPYEENIVRIGPQSTIGQLPEVKQTFQEAKSSA